MVRAPDGLRARLGRSQIVVLGDGGQRGAIAVRCRSRLQAGGRLPNRGNGRAVTSCQLPRFPIVQRGETPPACLDAGPASFFIAHLRRGASPLEAQTVRIYPGMVNPDLQG